MIDKFSCGFINSVYEFNDFTLNELICKLAQKMDEVITQSNESFNYLDWENNTYYKRVGSSATSTETMYIPITQNEWDGVKDLYIRGNARHCESLDIQNMYNEHPNADYVILEACLNDGFISVPKGSLSSSYNDTFTTTTYTSAFEYMLQKSITLFPNA